MSEIDDFIAKWAAASLAERAHYQTFISQLCRILHVPAPDDERPGDRDYKFERSVRYDHEDGSHTGFIDCYRQGCFVLEAKQSDKRMRGGALDPHPDLAVVARGKSFRAPVDAVDRLMRHAKKQAEFYARGLEEWPPFLMLVDVGRSIELWSDFAQQGKVYVPFPDRAHHRIALEDLRDPEIRQMLAKVWADPLALDPTRLRAAVTTDISARLAWLVRSIGARAPLDQRGAIDPVHRSAWTAKTATFVMQCIFAMFADSVGLIESNGFRQFLESYRGQADYFHKGVGDFFRRMHEGGHCAAIRQDLRRFNGGLFKHDVSLPITEAELEALIEAARLDWARVEPAIFGALLEQALDADYRAELGVHHTPRAFVEELLLPTVMEPLRAEWEGVEALAIGEYLGGNTSKACRLVQDFHRSLCTVRVLDPACGTGNFLYVAMHMMKELESEVLAVLADLGETHQWLDLDGIMVGPAQFWGMEKNAGAVAIAELVMWIGHLQWHFRMHGRVQPSEPILRNFQTIREMDALLSCEPGVPASQARVQDLQQPEWPDAHFIVGNPPFMGAKDQRRILGATYVDALWAIRQGRFRSADLATCWWDRAAEILTRKGSSLRRFGFITTNSITQTFSRRVVEHHLAARPAVRLAFAIPDHPWTKGAGSAAVRVSMTVVERGEPDGRGCLLTVIDEGDPADDRPRIIYRERRGVIAANLTVGTDTTRAQPLRANAALCSRGVQLMGAGFIVDPVAAERLHASSDPALPSPIRQYRNGRDLTDRARGVEVIDLFGWDEVSVRRGHPGVYQHLLETVKPDRDTNNRASYRTNWWVFGEPRGDLRRALQGLKRYIVTVETAKHRWFSFLDGDILPDNRLVCVASDDPFVLGILSSRVHGAWARATGALLEDRPVYAKGACFDRFPFPQPTPAQREDIAVLAEELDSLRARVLGQHEHLSMTGLYNARDRLTQAFELTGKHRQTHQDGCVHVIDHLHMRLDQVVSAAYGWPSDLSDEALVQRLVSLNLERVAAESRGEVLYIRPGFQQGLKGGVEPSPSVQDPLPLATGQTPALPATDDAMASVLLHLLRRAGRPLQPGSLAKSFASRPSGRASGRIERVLSVLTVAGSVQRTSAGWFAP